MTGPDRMVMCSAELCRDDMRAVRDVLAQLGVRSYTVEDGNHDMQVAVPCAWLWVVQLRRALPVPVFWPAVTAGAASPEARDAVLTALALGGVSALQELLPSLPRAQDGQHAEEARAPP